MLGQKKNSSAKVVGTNLILSFPNAQNPVVWRMPLDEARTSALEVKQKDNAYLLVLKTPKGDSADIAPFNTKDDATDALMAVARAMEQAPVQATQIAGGQNLPQQSGSKGGWRWIIPALLILAALFFFMKIDGVTPVDSIERANSDLFENSDDVGVPQSADDYLGAW